MNGYLRSIKLDEKINFGGVLLNFYIQIRIWPNRICIYFRDMWRCILQLPEKLYLLSQLRTLDLYSIRTSIYIDHSDWMTLYQIFSGTVGNPFPGVEVCIAKPNVYKPVGYDVIASGNHRATKETPG